VTLLFDQNLSPRLVAALSDLYPRSIHVRDVGLQSADDADIWEHASLNGLAVISKDSDFLQRSLLYGSPPKVVWVRAGNCSTAEIEAMLRCHRDDVRRFLLDRDSAFLALP
jgi:predicted nuclease of predicted toxin-antitoxin system